MKPRRDQDFVYYESLNSRCSSDSEQRYFHFPLVDKCPTTKKKVLKDSCTDIPSSSHFSWSVLKTSYSISKSNVNDKCTDLSSAEDCAGSQSQSPRWNPEPRVYSETVFVDSCVSSANEEGGFRGNSSTRLDFLDLEDNFLSASPSALSDSSGMADIRSNEEVSGPECQCTEDDVCKSCKAAPEVDLTRAVLAALEKMDKLTEKVGSLQSGISALNSRLEKLEDRESDGQASARSVSLADLSGKGSGKKGRVEEEKDRQFRVLQEKLKNRKQKAQPSDEESSDGGFDLKALRKSLSKKQKNECDRKVAARLKQAGAVFPEDDTDSSSSSGTESDRGRSGRHRRQVKSGAKVKRRPVLRTEL